MGNDLDRWYISREKKATEEYPPFFYYQDRILFGKYVYKMSEYYAYFRLV